MSTLCKKGSGHTDRLFQSGLVAMPPGGAECKQIPFQRLEGLEKNICIAL